MVKKILKWMGISLLSLILLVCLFGFYITYRPDVRIYSINRYIIDNSPKWGTIVELTPDVLNKRMQLEKVEARLKSAGYTKNDKDNVWPRYDEKTGKNKFIYTREANNMVCNIKLYVFIEVDKDYQLIKAEGTQHEHGCL